MVINECPVYTGTFHSKETEMGQCIFKPSVCHIYTFRCEPPVVITALLGQGSLKIFKRNTNMEKTPLLLLKKSKKAQIFPKT